MPVRLQRWLWSLLVLALPACGEAVTNPEGTFIAAGTILGPSGAPLASQQVGFWRYEPVGAVLSGGLTLLTQLTPRATTTTDSEGKFQFEVRGSDTHVVGVPSIFRVATRGGSYGAGSDLFLLNDGSRAIPPIRLWNGIRSVELRSGGAEPVIAAEWEAAPPAAGDPVAEYRVEITSSDGVVWIQSMDPGATTASIPQVVLNDVAESYAVSISAHHRSGNHAWAETRSVTPLAVRAPVELAAVTASEGADGAARVIDGNFLLPWMAPAPAGGASREVQLTAELAEPQYVARILLHGLSTGGSTLRVEASEDGENFVEIAQIQAPSATNWVDHWLQEPVRTRFLRLRLNSASIAVSLAELRVF